jgi:membrane fusion protein (multidrug efflux system)
MDTLKISAGILLAALLAGCSKPSAPPQMPPPEVTVVKVAVEALPVTAELPGRIDAERVAQVRARATGIILKRLFTEGSEVKADDVLFQIDPAPLQAAYDSAKANVTKAEAGLAQTQAKTDRYKALVALNAVSKQDYDDALGASLQAKAEVEAAKASLETASLNLGYTKVTAPISGKIGEAKVTEGAFVQTDTTELAVVQQLDPIYFDFTQSSTDMLRLKSSLEKGELKKVETGEAKITLILEDGSTYQYPGKLWFSDVTVDPGTGMFMLRAEFPNPDHLLLPGMFARGQVEQAVNQNAISVPQRAVAIKGDGTGTVMAVGDDNKVEVKTVKLGDANGDKWVVTDGLKAGNTIIVEGLQKVKPGMAVKPVPFEQS